MTSQPPLSVTLRYDLGLVMQCTNQRGAIVYLFVNEIIAVEPRALGVYITIRGHPDEFWIGCGTTTDETKKFAEVVTATIASARMNGVDKL